jgi:hypothetical protein
VGRRRRQGAAAGGAAETVIPASLSIGLAIANVCSIG